MQHEFTGFISFAIEAFATGIGFLKKKYYFEKYLIICTFDLNGVCWAETFLVIEKVRPYVNWGGRPQMTSHICLPSVTHWCTQLFKWRHLWTTPTCMSPTIISSYEPILKSHDIIDERSLKQLINQDVKISYEHGRSAIITLIFFYLSTFSM